MYIKEIKIPVKNVKMKTICHCSDLHLSAFDEFSTAEEKEKAINSHKYWIDKRHSFAKIHNEPCYNDTTHDLYFCADEILNIANKSDALVMTGDLMDYASDANIRFLEKKCSNLKVSFIAVRGNHEKDLCLSEKSVMYTMQQPVSLVDLGDIQIIGIDNANRSVSKEQLAELDGFLGKKPSIIAMHIPIMTEQNYDILMNCGEYFRMNDYPGCPAESDEFIRLICRPQSKVIAVLTGHLHFGNISEIGNGVYQYGVSQGLAGNAYIFKIGEE